MPTVIITGAGGFLGSNLGAFFLNKGWHVKALVHYLNSTPTDAVSYYQYELEREPDISVFNNCDCIIHCAYAKQSKGIDAYSVNVKGTEKLIVASRKAGVQKTIFISSISSKEDALSVYGKQKYACEKLFNPDDDLIIRPGLIIGNGGMFAKMKEYLQKSRIVPLISGGNQPMQVINANDLCEAIFLSLQKNLSGTYCLASNESLTYKEFYSLLCNQLGRKPIFISIPYSFLYFFLTVAESLSIRLAITRENLLGLKMQTRLVTIPDLEKIGISLKPPEEIIV